MNRNDNSSTGAFVISLTFAVVVFTALFIQYRTNNQSLLIAEKTVVEDEILPAEPIAIEETHTLDVEWVEEEISTPEPPAVISFEKAFAIAREALGSGQTFTWNGNQYSTNTAEEAEALAANKNTEINLTDAQDSLTLSLVINPEL